MQTRQHTTFTAIRPDDQVRQAIQEEESEPMNGSQKQRNLKVVASCIAVVCVMIGLTAYAPTAYRLFCAATGFGGTPQRADSYSGSVSDRTVKVRFDANVASGMPWRFEPVQREVRVHLGEQQLVFFTAENLSDQTIAGRATFNVTPETSGVYFTKIQCFCFDDERLDAHQKIDMPLVFFVDPALAKDPEMDDLDTITLSYTFFRSEDLDKAKDLSRFLTTARPDPVEGQKLFGERCAACHAFDDNKAGPMLDGVFGRKAGLATGYNYSPALAGADLTWSGDNLDHWLADPRRFVPGVKMPVRVLAASARRDIIAYLEKETSEARTRIKFGSTAQHVDK
jgi:cytochrome c oxidase assembly protein subunit 11